MKYIKYILPLFFFFSFGKYATAQPDYNLRFELVSTNSSEYVVDIFMSFTSAVGLGTSNLVFSYNGADISSPMLVSHNLSGNYQTPNISLPAANTASLNIEQNTANAGLAIGVFPSETNLVRVSFTVLDPNGFSNLQWLPGHSLHVVFLDNENDMLNAGSLEPLNTSPLPLELLTFKAKALDGAIELYWKSVNEVGFSGYEIQRSEDGRHFTKIGWQPGLGGAWEQPYSFLDKEVQAGVKYYYRLRQTDLNGQYKYSPMVSAELPDNSPELVISPNPNGGLFTIRLSENGEGPTIIRLVDSNGRNAWEANLESGVLEYGNQEPLPSGVYVLRVEHGRRVWVERVVVQ